MALGLEKAGFFTQMAIEIDKWAVETLKANRPNWNILKADITKISTDEIISNLQDIKIVASEYR